MQSGGRTFTTSQQHLGNARIKMGQEKLEKFKRSLRGHGIPTEHLFHIVGGPITDQMVLDGIRKQAD